MSPRCSRCSNTNPATTDRFGAPARRQPNARNALTACIAILRFMSAPRARNTRDLGELERLPGAAGVKFSWAIASTGFRQGSRTTRACARCSRRSAAARHLHSEDEYRLRERMRPARRGRSALASGVWRDAQAAPDVHAAAESGWRSETGKRVHVLHVTHQGRSHPPRRPQGRRLHGIDSDARASLPLAAPECYERLAASHQLNPPDPRRRASRRPLAQPRAKGVIDSIGSDPNSPHARGEGARLSKDAIPA